MRILIGRDTHCYAENLMDVMWKHCILLSGIVAAADQGLTLPEGSAPGSKVAGSPLMAQNSWTAIFAL